jgi:hypothetical protein
MRPVCSFPSEAGKTIRFLGSDETGGRSMEDRYARLGAWGGIVAVVMLLVGFGLVGANAPHFDEPARTWAGFISDHATRIHIGVTIVGVGVFFFLWFLGSLRTAMSAGEGGEGRLASIAFGAGLVSAAVLLVTLTGTAAAAFRPQANPDITRAMNDLGALAAAPAAGALTAFFAAIAVAGYRFRFVPAWVAGFSALAAVAQPFALAVIFKTSGVFAPDGALGLFLPVLTFAIATASVARRRYCASATTASSSSGSSRAARSRIVRGGLVRPRPWRWRMSHRSMANRYTEIRGCRGNRRGGTMTQTRAAAG